MWFQTLLNNTMIADGKLADLIASSHSTFRYKPCPDSMALFIDWAIYEDDKDQVITRVYFSPHCISYFPPMAFELFATACLKLCKEKLVFLAGWQDAFVQIDQIFKLIIDKSFQLLLKFYLFSFFGYDNAVYFRSIDVHIWHDRRNVYSETEKYQCLY
jgi:hypothetical protein